MNAPEHAHYAGLWLRVCAFVIDSLVWAIVTFPILILIYGRDYFLLAFSEDSPFFWGFWDLVIDWGLFWVVQLLFWIRAGASPGKIVCSLYIVDARTGGHPTAWQFVLRSAGHMVSLLALGLGFIMAGFDRRRQGFHDKIAGTVVVDRLAESLLQTPMGRVSPTGEPRTSRSADVAALPPWRLNLFRAGATTLLLATAVGGVNFLTRRTEVAGALVERGFLPLVGEITIYGRGLALFVAVALGLVLTWRAGHRLEARLLAFGLGFHFFAPRFLGPLGVPPVGLELALRLSQWLTLAAVIRFVTVFPRKISPPELSRPGGVPGPVRRTLWWVGGRLEGLRLRIRSWRTGGGRSVLGRSSGPSGVEERSRVWMSRRWKPAPLAVVLRPALIWGGAVALGLATTLARTRFPAATDRIAFLGAGSMSLVAFRLLQMNLRGASAEERHRGLWAAYGLMLAIGLPLAIFAGGVSLALTLEVMNEGGFAVPELPLDYVGVLWAISRLLAAPLILTVALAVAVFYRGAVDPALAIRRTTLYAGIGVMAVFGFATVEFLVSSQLSRLMPVSDLASALLSAGLTASTVGLMRKRLVRRTNAFLDPVLSAPAGPSSRPGVPSVLLAADLVVPLDAASIKPQELLASYAILARQTRRLGAPRGGRPLESLADAVLLEFGELEAALEVAAALQDDVGKDCAGRGLPPVSVSVGVHTGVVERNSNGEAEGLAVDVAVSLARLAHPGGVVVSHGVAEKVRGLNSLIEERLSLNDSQVVGYRLTSTLPDLAHRPVLTL